MGARSARARDAGLGLVSVSNLRQSTKRLNLPQQRDDFSIGADEVPSDVLAEWQAGMG